MSAGGERISSDEQTLLRGLLDTLNAGDLLLGDAYYASYFLLCALHERGVEAVFEQYGARRRSTDFRRGRRLGVRDHLIELRKPKQKPDWMTPEQYDAAPEALTVRELATAGKILVTTLLCSCHSSLTRVFPKTNAAGNSWAAARGRGSRVLSDRQGGSYIRANWSLTRVFLALGTM